jgi:hypothetical protein
MNRGLPSLLFFVACATGAASAQSCREVKPEAIVGKCFTVHGRYNIYADGDAIWVVGTNHRLSVVDDDLDKLLMKKGWADWSAFADFNVCPLSRFEPGHRQDVCIRDNTHLRFRKWN